MLQTGTGMLELLGTDNIQQASMSAAVSRGIGLVVIEAAVRQHFKLFYNAITRFFENTGKAK